MNIIESPVTCGGCRYWQKRNGEYLCVAIGVCVRDRIGDCDGGW